MEDREPQKLRNGEQPQKLRNGERVGLGVGGRRSRGWWNQCGRTWPFCGHYRVFKHKSAGIAARSAGAPPAARTRSFLRCCAAASPLEFAVTTGRVIRGQSQLSLWVSYMAGAEVFRVSRPSFLPSDTYFFLSFPGV